MQGNSTDKGYSGVVNITVKEVPRTQKLRKKNWKCNFPSCNETPKTKYNVYAHVWDLHLRPLLSQPGNNPDHLILTSYKNSEQKDVIKKMCDKYMVKLVDKSEGKQTFPFSFTESMAPAISTALKAKIMNGINKQNNNDDNAKHEDKTKLSYNRNESIEMALHQTAIIDQRNNDTSINMPYVTQKLIQSDEDQLYQNLTEGSDGKQDSSMNQRSPMV